MRSVTFPFGLELHWPRDATEWAAWASIAVAVATAALAFATRALASKTSDVAVRTGQLAATTSEEMKLLREQTEALKNSSKLAGDTLGELTKQTSAAHEANVEARRQRHLALIPMLEFSYRATTFGEGGVFSSFSVFNPGPPAALDVRIVVFGLTAERQPTANDVAHSRRIPVLAPSREQEILVDMNEVRNVPVWPTQQPEPEALFSHDWLRINLEYRSMLGARIIQRYDMYARSSGLKRWDLREVEIRPDPQDQGWIERLTPDP